LGNGIILNEAFIFISYFYMLNISNIPQECYTSCVDSLCHYGSESFPFWWSRPGPWRT